MLGFLGAKNPKLNGLVGDVANFDTNGTIVKVQASARVEGPGLAIRYGYGRHSQVISSRWLAVRSYSFWSRLNARDVVLFVSEVGKSQISRFAESV